MPFLRPTLRELAEQVAADIEARIPGADARTRRSVLGELARVLAGALHGMYGYLDWTALQVLVDTAEAEQLDRHGQIWGVTRKPAAYASGIVTLSGADGALIPDGTQLRRADGREYAIIGEGQIVSGSVSIAVEALEPGAAGDVDPGTPLNLISPIAGVQSQAVVSASGIAGGADAEADRDLRARILARIQEPPHGGAAHDYVAWAKEVAGVTRAWVFPAENGPGTLVVRFMMDDARSPTGIPLAGDVAAVQAVLDARRPVTADARAAAPVPVPLTVTIAALSPVMQTVKDEIAAELADLIRREAQPGGTLLLSHLREAISVAAGEHDHHLVSPDADVITASTAG